MLKEGIYLERKLRYNTETGQVFIQLLNGNWSEHKTLIGKGYPCTSIWVDGKNKSLLNHRIAWFLMTGDWPITIDHINGVMTDNRWINLRNVTHRDNNNNYKRHREGYLVGTHLELRSNKWRATIQVGKKFHTLGRFNTQQEAHAAYLKAREEFAV